MTPDRDNIRFNVLRNALYHSARRRSLERKNRIFNFVVVILGTAAFGDLFGMAPIGPEILGAAVAFIGALQLVFDFGRQARDHQALQREYYHLLADIEAATDDGMEHCAEWWSRMIRITADEPPVMKGLDARAYNDAADAMELPRGERLVVPYLHRMLAGIHPLDGHEYPKRSEIDQAKV